MTHSHTAVVLFAHGSRDPQWSRPIEAVAERMRGIAPGIPVTCAYLELSTPDLAGAVQAHVAAGVRQVRIVPMFLGVGRHARQDLPVLLQSLRAAHPEVRFELQPAIGEQAEMVDLMARIALRTEPPRPT